MKLRGYEVEGTKRESKCQASMDDCPEIGEPQEGNLSLAAQLPMARKIRSREPCLVQAVPSLFDG